MFWKKNKENTNKKVEELVKRNEYIINDNEPFYLSDSLYTLKEKEIGEGAVWIYKPEDDENTNKFRQPEGQVYSYEQIQKDMPRLVQLANVPKELEDRLKEVTLNILIEGDKRSLNYSYKNVQMNKDSFGRVIDSFITKLAQFENPEEYTFVFKKKTPWYKSILGANK